MLAICIMKDILQMRITPIQHIGYITIVNGKREDLYTTVDESKFRTTQLMRQAERYKKELESKFDNEEDRLKAIQQDSATINGKLTSLNEEYKNLKSIVDGKVDRAKKKLENLESNLRRELDIILQFELKTDVHSEHALEFIRSSAVVMDNCFNTVKEAKELDCSFTTFKLLLEANFIESVDMIKMDLAEELKKHT